MRCCVSSCDNTSENTSQSDCITFHSFPSEVHLRAAWLRVLGKQGSHLPDSAVVCSQHFLIDDIYNTQCGLRQIVTGAIPSTVQVCMICLDTDSTLILMSKHKLEEIFEKLTGHPLCDRVNLKPTLCVQCAQRLINFRKFRDKSLRARALMLDLVDKHKLITRQHIKMINRTKHQLKSSMVLTTLGPDHCDLHILEHPSEDKHTESDANEHRIVVKTEESDNSMSVDENIELSNEDGNNANDFDQNPVKYESTPFQCTICLEEFIHEHAYMQHMSMHLQNGAGDGECDMSQVCKPHTAVSSSSSHSSLITENKSVYLPVPITFSSSNIAPPSASLVTSTKTEVPPTEEVDTNVSCQYKTMTDCFVKLYDIFAKTAVQRQDRLLMKTGRDAMSCGSRNTVSKDVSHQATSQNEVPTTEYIEPVTNSRSRVKVTVLQTLPSKTDDINNIQCNNSSRTAKSSFICDICGKNYKQNSLLVKHIKTHSGLRRFTCKICQYKCKFKCYLALHMRTHSREKLYCCQICEYKYADKRSLTRHMKTHTGEKPFTCKICNKKFAQSSHLVSHMSTHTGVKPYACELCEYKCAKKSNLVYHMSTHTGIKPYVCELCEYKCARKSDLVCHMKTHTDEKLFTCKICNKKFARSSHLVGHMSTHTGIKPYACELCEYKCAQKSNLVCHMNTHTGKKLFTCKICNKKFARSSHLVGHMSTHTGIKPYACELCEYKCAKKSNFVYHMRTHTGIKPYACELCEYKCAQKSNLVCHMNTHTGKKLFTCKICNKKIAQNSHLVGHMSTHTGIKPYACELCEYKCAKKSNLVYHMSTHTGIKPYECELCEYKCARKSDLVCHMKTHTDEKLFTCKICNKKFARSSHLVGHMSTHTGIKPYACELCEYKCAQKSNLVCHMNTHTGEKLY